MSLTHSPRALLAMLCLVVATLAPAPAALAQAGSQEAGPISVNINMARVLRLNGPAATVIVGNPGIADVTIQDPRTLILTGKTYGRTNLIVLDASGHPVADTLIEVVQLQAGVLTIYQGLARTSFTCAPVCQPNVMLGDYDDFTAEIVTSSNYVEGLAR